MTLDEREDELNNLFDEGSITQREWALLYIQAQEDGGAYPNEEKTNEK